MNKLDCNAAMHPYWRGMVDFNMLRPMKANPCQLYINGYNYAQKTPKGVNNNG